MPDLSRLPLFRSPFAHSWHNLFEQRIPVQITIAGILVFGGFRL
jgi:hypothetical protein